MRHFGGFSNAVETPIEIQWKIIIIVGEKCNFCGFLSSSFCRRQRRNDMWYWWYHRYKRWQAGIQSLSLSFSKMQTKLKNALQLSFATCQHSPWFLMTFEMMHQPRIHNSSSSQFCPISNFNLRCNFLFLHFTVTFTFSVILFASISFRSWEQIVSFFR